MMEWQPIETAPKDGSRFIAWTGYMTVSPVEWQEGGVISEEGFLLWWQDPAGGCLAEVRPTHWMPLPAPPTN